jgi:hypothetical protein
MKFNIYRQFGALNSIPIFDAFSRGVKQLGYSESQELNSIPVIWSVLWAGRMLGNRAVYEQAVARQLPVVVIEVGNLKRNQTWRISVDNVNSQGYFGNDINLDTNRLKNFNSILSTTADRKKSILITTQRHESLQWQGMPPIEKWINQTVSKVRQYSNRPIVVRPHPRSRTILRNAAYTIDQPKKLMNSYDDFNIDYNYHCVISHNNGTVVQAAINGTPIICDSTCLAAPVSDVWSNLENIQLPSREDWYLKLCHTEWTVNEIAQGIPLMRLVPYLKQRLESIG